MPRVCPARLLATVLVAVVPLGCSRSSQPTSPSGPGTGGIDSSFRTLVEVTADLADVTTGYTGTENWPGQSVTIPGTGTYNNIRFSWYHYNPAGTPVAFGTLYLLTQEYLGLPSDLSSATAGYVARSESADGGVYVFPVGTTVTGGRQYWFYSDTRGRFTNSFNKDIYLGGDAYVCNIQTMPFRKSAASWLRLPSGEYLIPPAGTCTDNNFKLQGTTRQ